MTPGRAIIIRRRIIRVLWGVARVLGYLVAAIVTRRISVKRVAGLVPARFRRT